MYNVLTTKYFKMEGLLQMSTNILHGKC